MGEEYRPINQETDPRYNREPGIAVVPGSAYAKEKEKFEQFPSKYGGNPGNPYTYREFPKMLYRAEEFMGKVCCMAAPPDSWEYSNPNEYERACVAAQKFTERCQLTVKNEAEHQKAMENGWRENPTEAVELGLARQRVVSEAAAVRLHGDRNMSRAAKAEAKAAMDEAGVHLGEIPEKPVRRRGRSRGSKTKKA